VPDFIQSTDSCSTVLSTGRFGSPVWRRRGEEGGRREERGGRKEEKKKKSISDFEKKKKSQRGLGGLQLRKPNKPP
jgi:hypothetical protein